MSRYSLIISFAALLPLCVGGSEIRAQETGSPHAIIPRPESFETRAGMLALHGDLSVEAEGDELRHVARLLREYLAAIASGRENKAPSSGDSLSSEVQSGRSASGVRPGATVRLSIDRSLPVDGYNLDVDDSGVRIVGGSAAGVFHGVQTLRQMLPVHARPGEQSGLPFVSISDSPRFGWRGMHVDVSRHFFSMSDLRRFIDHLVLYKFNRLHLHLTDDQGWRLEIKRYPRLTDEGAWRTLNSQDSSVLRMGGNNPDFHFLPEEHFRGEGVARRYGGFYTQEEMRDLIAYAAERHVMVVPEVDMPGHFMAAIASYPELSCTGAAEWGEVFSVPLCPGKPEVFEFIGNILDEVAALFPSPYIHIGGDEVEKSTWMEHAGTLELMEREGLTTEDELQSWFIARVGEMLTARGKRLLGWDEIIEGGLPEGATVMHWRGWVPDAPVQAVRAGSDVVRSPTSCCYFDYAETDESLELVYAFEPVPAGLTEEESARILGLQANLWSEWIATPVQLEYMAFPRMLAISEVGWTGAELREWRDFRARVSSHYPRLDAMGVHYRVPRVASLHDRTVIIEDTTIVLRSPVPGIEIRYTTDGSLPTMESRAASEPLVVSGDTELRVRAFYPSGLGGPTQAVRIEKQAPREAAAVAEAVHGLDVAYYPIHVTRVDSIIGEPTSRATVPDVRVPEGEHAEAFALVFTGYVRVPEDGVYTFATHSDDGSTLHIGDRLVVDNDRPHGPLTVSGQVALRAGLHPIRLRFFESGGGFTLELRWSGPGVGAELETVPAGALFRNGVRVGSEWGQSRRIFWPWPRHIDYSHSASVVAATASVANYPTHPVTFLQDFTEPTPQVQMCTEF